MPVPNPARPRNQASIRPFHGERSEDSARALLSARGRHPRTRAEPVAIDETALLDRLQDHALGMVDMTSTQVRAAEVALKKAEVADEPESHAVRKTISAEPLSEAEWQQQYAR